MDVFGGRVLHPYAITARRDATASAEAQFLRVTVVVRLEAARGADGRIEVTAVGLQPLPRIVLQFTHTVKQSVNEGLRLASLLADMLCTYPEVAVVAEDEPTPAGIRQPARNDDRLVDASADQAHPFGQLDGGVLVVGPGLEAHRGVGLEGADLRAAGLGGREVGADVGQPGHAHARGGIGLAARRADRWALGV